MCPYWVLPATSRNSNSTVFPSGDILPVMRGHPKIYSTVDDIQALSIDDQPELVAQLVSEIVERLRGLQLRFRGLDTRFVGDG